MAAVKRALLLSFAHTVLVSYRPLGALFSACRFPIDMCLEGDSEQMPVTPLVRGNHLYRTYISFEEKKPY